jgi:hypothetical protein
MCMALSPFPMPALCWPQALQYRYSSDRSIAPLPVCWFWRLPEQVNLDAVQFRLPLIVDLEAGFRYITVLSCFTLQSESSTPFKRLPELRIKNCSTDVLLSGVGCPGERSRARYLTRICKT